MKLAVLMVCGLMVAPQGALAHDGSNKETVSTKKATVDLEQNHWFNLERTLTVFPVSYANADGGEVVSKINQPLLLVEGTQFLVVNKDAEKKQITLAFNLEGQDDDQENPLPAEITVEMSDLASAHVSPIVYEGEDASEESMQADIEDDALADQPFFAETEVAGRGNVRRARSGKGLRVRQTPAHASSGANAGVAGRVIRVRSKNGMTMCLAEVRVNAKSICGQAMPAIERASLGYDLYKSAGWRPIEFNPTVSPVCTACFWKGGRTDCSGGAECGHASLKIGPNSWIGAGIRPQPQLPNESGCHKKGKHMVCRVPYRLDGCLTAPGVANPAADKTADKAAEQAKTAAGSNTTAPAAPAK